MSKFTIAVLPGDGIGPEVVSQGVKVLESIGAKFKHNFQLKYGLAGGSALDEFGVPLPTDTIDLCRSCNAVLFGSVGDPKWDHLKPPRRAEYAIGSLRRVLGLSVNLRPVKVFPQLVNCTPFKPGVVQGVDLVIARELLKGFVYRRPRHLEPSARGRRAVNTVKYTEKHVQKFLRVVFEVARSRRQRLSLAGQHNALETSRLWKMVCEELAAEYPDVEVEYMYPDDCAARLIRTPTRFDVLTVDDLFAAGMLNDQGAVIMGSVGMVPSAELRPKRKSGEDMLSGVFGLYEPAHGSAPKYTGLNKVNPIATILSVSLMLRYSLKLSREAEAIVSAIEQVLQEGYRTYDIMEDGCRKVGTDKMGDLIANAVSAP